MIYAVGSDVYKTYLCNGAPKRSARPAVVSLGPCEFEVHIGVQSEGPHAIRPPWRVCRECRRCGCMRHFSVVDVDGDLVRSVCVDCDPDQHKEQRRGIQR